VKVWEINHEKGEVLAEEIAHLKSFGWSDTRVAERLGITVSAIEKRRRAGRVES
jgi:plasmid maintenance system antidote protein VapI